MRVCPVPGCPNLVKRDAYRGLCDVHRKARDRARGSRQERGYGSDHQAERARWQAKIDQRPVPCARCGLDIPKGSTDWDLGHTDDRATWTGPEHARECNRAAAGRSSHRKKG